MYFESEAVLMNSEWVNDSSTDSGRLPSSEVGKLGRGRAQRPTSDDQ